MTHAVHLAGVLVVSQITVYLLARARWTWRATRAAIVTWQALGLAWAVAAVGVPLAIGLAGYRSGPLRALPHFAADLGRGVLPPPPRLAAIGLGLALGTLVIATHLSSVVAAVRARSRHRALLTLVARRDAAAPGALVLDHPAAAAYCLPGLRATVVVSAGTLDLLNRAELAAVLSHERAHATERHDLVLLPFTALCRALPGLRWPGLAYDAVSLLIEMRADDRAVRQHQARSLATALVRFATAPGGRPPAGALGAAGRHPTKSGSARPGVPHSGRSSVLRAVGGRHLLARVERLRTPVPSPPGLPTACLALALALLATGVCLIA